MVKRINMKGIVRISSIVVVIGNNIPPTIPDICINITITINIITKTITDMTMVETTIAIQGKL